MGVSSHASALEVEGADAPAALAVEDLTVNFGDRRILDQVRLHVRAGESVAVTGRSGSGKSTLLNCVLGLTRPDSGTVRVGGVDIATATRRRLAQVRREAIGMVFQSGELLPELSPEENVMVAALLAGRDVGTAQRLAREILASLGVPSGSRSVTEFSGGERQRVAVARALVNRPRLVLADEPTGSLDPATRDTVAELLYQLPRQFDCALVVVTHDPVVAQQADHLVNLDQHQPIHEPIA